MRDPNFDVQKLIEGLNGTCNSLEMYLRELYPDMEWEDLTQEDYQAIDLEIFECGTCNWWHETHEEAEGEGNGSDRICQDCYDSENYEEDD